jgi:hypothetical protein
MEKQIVALFTDPEAIDRVIAALHQAGFAQLNSRVIESLSQGGPDSLGATLPSLDPEAGWSNQEAPRYTEVDLLATMGLPEEEMAFYSQGMEMGGQLLVITVDNSQEERACRILAEHDGQFATNKFQKGTERDGEN